MAAAAITRAHAESASERAYTARQHRTRLRRAGIPALAGLLVLASCAAGGAASPSAAPPSSAAPTVPTTVARTTVPTTIAKPPPVTLPVPTIVTVPVANTAVAPTAAPVAGGGGGGGGGGGASGGNATEGYGPFGPFNVGTLDDASRAAVATTVEAYLVAASVLPLRSREEPDLRAVLTPAALGRLAPQVLAVVADGADSGLPRLEGVSLVKADVGVDGIVGPDGGQVATASIDTLVTATTEGGAPVSIARRGNLVLVPGPSGWQIDELDLTVDRDLP